MSDCGVCLTGYTGDAEESDFCDPRIVTARKSHECGECGRPIHKGEKYERTAGANAGRFWHFKSCLVCAEIANAFFCDGRWYGILWDEMHEVILNLNTSCFDKLQTAAAKAELQRRWMKAKGLAA